MSRKDPAEAMHADHERAHRETRARERLMALGGNELEPQPWRPAPVPPSAVDLVQLALWRSAERGDGELGAEDLLSALALLPAARAEVDGLEDGLLFLARSAGLTWAQIAEAMGFRSPQACQQHYARLSARQGSGT